MIYGLWLSLKYRFMGFTAADLETLREKLSGPVDGPDVTLTTGEARAAAYLCPDIQFTMTISDKV